MKRKAQSEIITTILLILIVLAAVVVVWMVISRFINPTKNAGCATLKLRVIGANAGSDNVTINRMTGGSEVNITNMTFVVNGKRRVTVYPSAGTDLYELETKQYTVANSAGAASDGLVPGDRIQVSPIIDIGGGQTTICDSVGEISAT